MSKERIEAAENRAARLDHETGPRLGFTVCAGSISINILALALPLVLLQVFDRVVPNKAEDTLSILFMGLVVALLLDVVLKGCRTIVLGHFAEEYELQKGREVVEHIVDADPYHFESTQSATQLDRFGGIATLRDYYGGQGRLLAIDLPFALVFVGMIWFIGGWLVLVPLSSLAVLIVFSQVLRFKQAPALEARQSIDQRRYAFLHEVIEGITTVKSQVMEHQMIRRYELLQDQSSLASQKLIRVAGFSQNFGAVFGQVSIVALGGFGSYLIVIGSIGMAELSACMLLNGRTSQPMLKMLSLWVELEGVRSAKAKISEIKRIPLAGTDTAGADIKGSLSIENVALRIEDRKRVLFAGLNIDLHPGEAVSIMGDDGGGKTSLLRMILGEQMPSCGRITIDGLDPRKLARRRNFGEIAYVDQFPFVLNGTILDNLSLFGDAEACRRGIAAAEEIGLDDDIHRLPMGYDTEMGTTSQWTAALGLQQRIAIARTLARDPKLFLFNEANTALDFNADKLVLRALEARKGEMTMVIVSRRPSYRRFCDKQIELADFAATKAHLRMWEEDEESKGVLVLSEESRISA